MVYCLSNALRIHIKRGYEQEKVVDACGEIIDPSDIDFESSMTQLEKKMDEKLYEDEKQSSNYDRSDQDICNYTEEFEDGGDEILYDDDFAEEEVLFILMNRLIMKAISTNLRRIDTQLSLL